MSLIRRLLLAFCCLLATQPALAQPRIGVLTMQPGEIFWERFGHNAIVVDDPAKGGPVSYNYGFFDMGEPDFNQRFIAGTMQYYLVPLPLEEDLATYRQEGRGTQVQWLNLTPAQATALQQALEENALPQNRRYHYDYFRSNCTTKVRDAIDRVLGGSLRAQLEASSTGTTYRSEAARLSSPEPWMRTTFEALLGPATDRPLSLWDEAFIPQRLSESLARARTAEHQPLVSSTEVLLPHRLGQTPQDAPWRTWVFLLAGLALATAILALGRRHQRALAALALPFWLFGGLLGLVMLYAWLGTEHWAAAANRNLMLLSPLGLLMIWPALQWLRGRDSRQGRTVLAAIAALAVLAVLVLWLSPLQRNAAWVALLAPVHLALAHAFRHAPRLPTLDHTGRMAP